jgi:hypothetical protein
MNTYYISLSGYVGCTIIYNFNKYNIKYIESPFDYLRIKNINSVNNLINNNFIDLFNIDFFKLIKIESSNNFFNFKNKQNTYIYENTKFNIRFCHDFTTMIGTSEFDIELLHNHYLYSIKINNFFKFIYDHNNNFIFIRHELKHSHINFDNINILINIINTFNNNFIVKVIVHNSNINYIYEPLNKYQILNIPEKFGLDWKLSNINWNNYF